MNERYLAADWGIATFVTDKYLFDSTSYFNIVL